MKPSLQHALALLALLALPLVLLWPCLIGSRVYVPWDIAQFPPARTLMDDAEYAETIRNNNTIVTEIPAMFVPELRFIKGELDRGEFPQWNPYARSGTTVWSSSILGVWYPINWMMFAGGDPQSYLAFGAFLSIAIASLLMYGFLCSLGLSVPAALFGALAFGMSGTLTVNLHFYQRINALIWLPGMLWAIHAMAQRSGRRRVPGMLGLAGSLFMAHTAGFPPFALATTLLAAAFTVQQMGGVLRRGGGRETLTFAGTTAGGALLGVLLAAVQTLPSFGFFPESNRTMDAKGNLLASGGFDPAGLLGYLCPTIFNHPHINNTGQLVDLYSPLMWYLFTRRSWLPHEQIPPGTVFDPNLNFCEYTVFVGTMPLFFALAGLLRRRTPLRWFLGGTLLFLFALASAERLIGPLLEAAPFRWIPPTRYTGPTCLLVAALAAAGCHDLRGLSHGLRRVLAIGGLLLALVLSCCGMWVFLHTPAELLESMAPTILHKYTARYPNVPSAELPTQLGQYLGPNMPMAREMMVWNLFRAAGATAVCGLWFLGLPWLLRLRRGAWLAGGLAATLTVVELLGFGIPLNTGRHLKRRPLNDTPIHAFLRQQRETWRSSGGFAVVRAHAKQRGEVPLPSQLPPDTLLREHIRDVQAYTFVDKRSHLPILEMYGPQQMARDTWPLSLADDERLERPFWDMLGVRFVLSEDRLEHAGKQVGPVLAGPENAKVKTRFFYVYERPHPLPRAWVVHRYRTLPTEQEVVKALAAAEFAPTVEAVVDHETAARLGPQPAAPAAGQARSVTFPIPDQTNALTIDVGAGAPGFLVVNDTLMRGWTVTVGGQPATVHRANLFQRLVVLPAAATRIEFHYRTPGFVAGAALSLTALLICLGLWVWSRRRPRRTELQPTDPTSPA